MKKGPATCTNTGPHFLDGHRLSSLYRAITLNWKFPCSNTPQEREEGPSLRVLPGRLFFTRRIRARPLIGSLASHEVDDALSGLHELRRALKPD
jgi:hypothetical protein